MARALYLMVGSVKRRRKNRSCNWRGKERAKRVREEKRRRGKKKRGWKNRRRRRREKNERQCTIFKDTYILSDPLPPVRPHLLKFPKPPKIAPPPGTKCSTHLESFGDISHLSHETGCSPSFQHALP